MTPAEVVEIESATASAIGKMNNNNNSNLSSPKTPSALGSSETRKFADG